ncbi:MAG: hypothetical protein J5I59_12635 [Saprospiraceae bacterium]|nr:hypothetical protein [Saprospiraceae bacterium]
MIRDFLIKYFLGNTLKKKAREAHPVKPFEIRNPSILLVHEGAELSGQMRQSMDTLLGRDFGKISHLSFVDEKSKHAPDKNILHKGGFTLRAELKDKEAKVDLKGRYDYIVDLDDISSPLLHHYLIKFSPTLMVRFNKDNEKFYNFIVPSENTDRLARIKQFFTIYQTLKK